MKILRLEVEGFRSLKQITWQPGDLNVIIGPNGSGKSNLLRLVQLISVSAQGWLAKHVQDSGGMEPLVWDGAADHISFLVRGTPLRLAPDEGQQGVIYRAKLLRLGTSGAYRMGDELLAAAYRADEGKKPRIVKLLERTGPNAFLFDEQQQELTAEQGVPEEETLLSQASSPWTPNREVIACQEQLAGWGVYHYFDVSPGAAARQATVPRYEKRVTSHGQNLITVLHTLYTGDRDFKREINSAMRAAFGDDFEELVFPPVADQRIQLRVRWKSLRREQSAADLPDGMLRFLFLLTTLASPSPAPVIAIDEPETGLHPSMLPIVAEYAVDAANRSQVILTTHSPQFLDAFRDTKPTTTVAKWVEGETVLRTVRGEELDYWLREYTLGALFRSGELEEMA